MRYLRPLTLLAATFVLVSVVPGTLAAGSVTQPDTSGHATGISAAVPAGSATVPAGSATADTANRGRMTTIVLRVTTCAHCPVTLQQALDDGTYWTSRTHHVRAGRATFTVPTRRTRGMTLVLNPRWANVTDAVTNVVTRYAHTAPGQVISNEVAQHKKRATACWAGTTRSRIVMKVRVVTFSARALGGGPGKAIRAWFKPMTASTPPMSRTWRGTLGNQDAYYCSAG
jgi:hypothetical protein